LEKPIFGSIIKIRHISKKLLLYRDENRSVWMEWMGRKLARFIQTTLVLVTVLFGYSAVLDSAFETWKAQFKTFAIAQGIRTETIDLAFNGLLPDSKVLELDTKQPEFTKTVWEYLESAASNERIAMGQARLREYSPLLKQLYAKYGVQPEYLLAIWGLESDFGRFTGRHSTIRSLATLAYEGNEERRDFWGKQLLAALRIIEEGDMSLVTLRGSWAGAIGHTQFIPTTFEAYAVDFDGDGKRDLVNSIPDALASTANYLAQSGWERSKPWGEEIRLPLDFDWSKADPNFWLPVEAWLLEGNMTRIDGSPLSGADSAFVLLPAGYRGPAFLAYHNFGIILKYNNAQNYALAVGYLGDRIRGKPPLQATWPHDEHPLSYAQKSELQELLTAAGYSTDGVDGRLGPNTRAALRRWQMDSGFPADGYATLEHLAFLRREAANTAPAE
jgi:membrane-bound lytic murein transglycosylase B